jgi:CheY-like chemotaxis protein
MNDDTDGDGIPNYLDIDDDDDGILTINEHPDDNGNGYPDDALDTDNDSTDNYLDPDDDETSTGGEYVVLSVTDSGPGINGDDLEHIFEPFYTRKTMGISGTGLGLTVAWNTVADHGGTIRVMSSGKGTTFDLYFPLSDEEVKVPVTQEDFTELQGKGECILVVDDDSRQRDIASQILERLGYTVETAASGEEGVAFLREHNIDMALLDMILGDGINGRETYQQMVKINPGQKALIVSGYAKNSEVSAALELGAAAFLKKPYTLVQLGRAIKKTLAGRGTS